MASDVPLISLKSVEKLLIFVWILFSNGIYPFSGVPRHARFHPSGSCIGVAMSTDVAKIYDIRVMKLLQYYPCHEGPVNSLSFHPSGKFMLTGGKDKTCKVRYEAAQFTKK